MMRDEYFRVHNNVHFSVVSAVGVQVWGRINRAGSLGIGYCKSKCMYIHTYEGHLEGKEE